MNSREALQLPLLQQAIAFCLKLRRTTIPNPGDLRNQIYRSAISIASNLSEGIGKGDVGTFFAIARGSAFECATQLTIAELDESAEECHRICAAIDAYLDEKKPREPLAIVGDLAGKRT